MNIVELDHVTKHFSKQTAVSDLSFSVKEGSVFGFLGPNGAGKTTTIRMLMDIYAPDTGTVRIFSKGPCDETRARTGYLPEDRGIYDNMKVVDQLRFFAELRGLSKSEAGKRIDEWLNRFDLAAIAAKKVSALSKGTQQKIQFIVSVLHDPDLLILDEPFTGLDPVSVDVMKGVIADLRRRGKTIIFSTHQMEQIEQLCDEICLIDRGTRLLLGPLRDIKKMHSRRIMRLAFDGPSNFLEAVPANKMNRTSNWYEIRVDHEGEPQVLLSRAMASGARVTRFELAEPTLDDIFIETVKAAAAHA